MQPWAIGVFASVDAGLGVHLEVAQELGIRTVQVHAPHQQTRTAAAAAAFLQRCRDAGITITCVFCGFEGESYADIATTARTVGLVPEATRAARVAEAKEGGRLMKEAGLTHGIRGIFWHQGENDQGADGPSGGYGWETYRSFFIGHRS